MASDSVIYEELHIEGARLSVVQGLGVTLKPPALLALSLTSTAGAQRRVALPLQS